MHSYPSACRGTINLLKQEPSAQSPWQNTILGFVGVDFIFALLWFHPFSFSIELDNGKFRGLTLGSLGVWSFAGFCCFCCFLPKNKSAGRPNEPDYLKDWKMRITLRNVLSCNAVAIFRDLHRRAVGKCA